MRAETSMNDLQALAARQQQQLHNQAAIIAAKEQRLRHLQAQIEEGENLTAGSEAASNEAERLRRLREKVEAQEAKLRKLRALRGQVEQQRISNGALSADLTSIRALFNEKEKELSMAAAQVEELTNQLEQLQFQANQAQAHPGTKAYFVHLHLERLRAELMYRNKLNDQKNSGLAQRKQQLLENRENISDLDKRIAELKDRLQRKKQLNQQLATQLSSTSQKQANKQQLQQRKGPHLQQQNQSQVAAVEPFNRQPPAGPASSNADEDVSDFCASKSDPKYQTLPHNTRFVPLIFNNNNNNNNNNSNIAPMHKAVKVASVPPQVSEKPALPPKPAVKPTLPPRQTPEKDIIHHLEELREKRESLQTPALPEKKEQEQKRDNGEVKEEAKEPPAPPPPAQPPPSESPAQDDLDDVFGGTEIETQVDDPITPPAPAEESDESGSSHTVAPSEGIARRLRKGNLKSREANRKSRRVSFDPLALLLDAALEGELELVKKTAVEVSNPSAANDEGITALHNAICAGHLDIVKFLVELGCDVNAQDSDGWTPLHCAASCNNLAMVKFLVDHGACIFAATLSDHETAAEKCEEDEEGFDGCSEYLYSIQEKLGILNSGRVYALFDYDAQNPDELSFKEGDELVVLRKGDDFEREWWWSRLGDQEGYVPRNLLGLNPRIHKQESEH